MKKNEFIVLISKRKRKKEKEKKNLKRLKYLAILYSIIGSNFKNIFIKIIFISKFKVNKIDKA